MRAWILTFFRMIVHLPQAQRAWRRVQLARHPKRPHSLDYIQRNPDGVPGDPGDRRSRRSRNCRSLARFEGRL